MLEATTLPENLARLHAGEEELRERALEIIAADPDLQLHLTIVERAMDFVDTLRQFETDDENLKVVQILSMRTFNAFAASLRLALSGYSQNSALVMRDILETVFLLDLFRGDRSLIERWRFADKRILDQEFRPVKVRMALDKRDGFTSNKRAEIYKLFSELAGHPTMKSSWMMRPQRDGDAVVGPFMERTTLVAAVSEMGRLALQVGEILNAFCPKDWPRGLPTRLAFAGAKSSWLATFYSLPTKSEDGAT